MQVINMQGIRYVTIYKIKDYVKLTNGDIT
jgi:hypothetical protein